MGAAGLFGYRPDTGEESRRRQLQAAPPFINLHDMRTAGLRPRLLLLSAILVPPDIIGLDRRAVLARGLVSLIISYNNVCKGRWKAPR